MKRLVMPLVSLGFALAIGAVVLTAPAVAVAHPGNTCNPPAGHGRSGCHRVTPSPTTTPAAKPSVPRKRVVAKAKPRPMAVPKAAPAPVAPAAPVTVTPSPVPTAPAAAAPAIATPAAPKAATPVPWWVALWHFLFG